MFNTLPSTEYITRSGRRVKKPERYIPNGTTTNILKDKNFEKIDPHNVQGSRNSSEIIIDKLGNTCNNSKKQDLLEIGEVAADRVSEPTTAPAIDIQTPVLQNIRNSPIEESWHFSFDDSLYEPPRKSESSELINILQPDENDIRISHECVGSNDNVARKLFETTTEKQDCKIKSVCISVKECTFLKKDNTSHSVSQCNNSKDIFEISNAVPIPETSKCKASKDISLERVNSNNNFYSVSKLGISNDNLEISKSLPVILTDEKSDIGLHNVTSNNKPSSVSDCIMPKDISETTYVSENILSKKSSEVLSPKTQPKFNVLENDFATSFSNLTIEPILNSYNTSCDLRNLNAVTALENNSILSRNNRCESFSNKFLPNTDFKAVSAAKHDLPTSESDFSKIFFDTSVSVCSATDSFIAAYVDSSSNSSVIMSESISHNNIGVLNSSIITAEEVDNGSKDSTSDRSVFSYQESSEDIRHCIPDDEFIIKRERVSPKVVKQSFETFEKCTSSTKQCDIPNLNTANDSECVNESIPNYIFDTTVSSVFKQNIMTVNSSVTSEIKFENVTDTPTSKPLSSVLSFKPFPDCSVSGLGNIQSELIDIEILPVKDGFSNHDFNLNDKEHTPSSLNSEISKKETEGAESKSSKTNVDKFIPNTEVAVGIKEVDESLILLLKKEAQKKSFANDTLSDRRTDDFKFQDKLDSREDNIIQTDRQDSIFSFSEDRAVRSKNSIVPLNLQVRDLFSQQICISESKKEDKENVLSPEVDFHANKLTDNKKNLYWSTRKSVSSPQLEHQKLEFASKIPELKRSVTNIHVFKVINEFNSPLASKFTTSDLKVRQCDGLKSFLAESRYPITPQRKGKSYAPGAADMKEKVNVVTPLKTHNFCNVRNCFPGLPKLAPRRCPKKFQNIQSPVAQYIKGRSALGLLKAVNGRDATNSTLPSHHSKASGIS